MVGAGDCLSSPLTQTVEAVNRGQSSMGKRSIILCTAKCFHIDSDHQQQGLPDHGRKNEMRIPTPVVVGFAGAE